MDENMNAERTVEAITPPMKYSYVPITDFIADHWVLFLIGMIVSVAAAFWVAKKLRGQSEKLDPVSTGVVALVAASTLLMFGLSHMFGGYKENIEDTENYQANYQTFLSNVYEYGMANGGYLIHPDDAQNFVDGYVVPAVSITDYYNVEVRLDRSDASIELVGSYPLPKDQQAGLPS